MCGLTQTGTYGRVAGLTPIIVHTDANFRFKRPIKGHETERGLCYYLKKKVNSGKAMRDVRFWATGVAGITTECSLEKYARQVKKSSVCMTMTECLRSECDFSPILWPWCLSRLPSFTSYRASPAHLIDSDWGWNGNSFKFYYLIIDVPWYSPTLTS